MAMAASLRSRATTVVKYSESEAEGVNARLGIVSKRSDPNADVAVFQEIVSQKVNALNALNNSFITETDTSGIKDAFRHHAGFQIIVKNLREIAVALRVQKDGAIILAILQWLESCFALLAVALRAHWGNQRYFRSRVENGGWESINDIFKSWFEGDPGEQDTTKRVQEDVLRSLLACAVNQIDLQRLLRPSSVLEALSQEDTSRNAVPESNPLASGKSGSRLILENPEAVSTLFQLWSKAQHSELSVDVVGTVTSDFPRILDSLSSSSIHNLVSLHRAGILKPLLSALTTLDSDSSYMSHLKNTAIGCLQLGITDLADMHVLCKAAVKFPVMADLLDRATKSSAQPACIHFDLSLHGFASVELPDLGRPFPPSGSSAGYTLSVWLKIVEFDAEAHTTIFGAFDSSQSCFVLVYLEKDSRNLILQTSITSARPSVRFKSCKIQPSRWYHLCLVHHRPKTTVSSRASLYVDGEFVEQVKALYPAMPTVSSETVGRGDLAVSVSKHKPVQAFLGTPHDLASTPKRGYSTLQWQMASALLFDDVLSDDLIAVHNQLGPRYIGNYQDCLGSFQTYQASATLNLRNESLHLGKEEQSDIMLAIRSKASELLPEHKVLLNISPTTVLDDDERGGFDQMQLIKALSTHAFRNLRNMTRGGRDAVLLNGATPSIDEALLHNYGIAVLTGDPSIMVPQSLDDAAWRAGGCAPVGLALLESASSGQDITRALNILLNSVQYSWRNSENMEKENGYGVLASLLTLKMEQIESEELELGVLERILWFVGYDEKHPENSIISNPLAYRILLVDLDVWRSCSAEVQKRYFEQFATFAKGSKHHNFNLKRLSRMRIVRKWLDALKAERFFADSFDYFIAAFKSLIGGAIAADTLRSLALHVTYATNKPKENSMSLLRPSKSLRRPRAATNPRGRGSNAPSPSIESSRKQSRTELSRLQIGVKVLEMYADLLCQAETTNIKKFARTVTNKWLLHLLSDDEPAIVMLTAKILGRVLVVNGHGYVEKFSEKTGGFIIMRYRLRRWWRNPKLWTICFAILFGRDLASIDLAQQFIIFNLLTAFASDETQRVVYPAVLPVLIAMLESGLRSVTKEQVNVNSPLAGKGKRHEFPPPVPVLDLRYQTMSSPPQSPTFPRNLSGRDTSLNEPRKLLQTVARFLADIHSKLSHFRDFSTTTTYIQELLFVLYPLVVSSDIVDPQTELNARDSSLTFNGNDVIIRAPSQNSTKSAPIVRTTSVENSSSPKASNAQLLNRRSSYILITTEESQHHPSSARLHSPISKPKTNLQPNIGDAVIEEVLEIIVAVFSDQILSRKDFLGIGLFMKVPPGFQEHQAYFESFMLRNTISHLSNTMHLNQKILWEPRVLTNLARFSTHLTEAVYEGWFIDGADASIDFMCGILEYVQRPDIAQLKSIRLCSEVISTIRMVLSRVILLRLSELDESQAVLESSIVRFLKKLTYWQTVLFASNTVQEDFLRLFCYLLYAKLISNLERVRDAATELWRVLLMQKLDETSGVLSRINGFQKVLELDNQHFLGWVDDNREELDALFFGKMSSAWEGFVATENKKTEDLANARLGKRREKLKVWHTDDMVREDIIRRHEISSDHWRSNIYSSEHIKCQRSLQDQQDTWNFNMSTWTKMRDQVHGPCGFLTDREEQKWQLDQTEGRNRMRLRLIPDKNAHLQQYQSKTAASTTPKTHRSTLQALDTTPNRPKSHLEPSPITRRSTTGNLSPIGIKRTQSPNVGGQVAEEAEDGFEIVDEPRDDPENFEDKNRKVMRSLQRGEQVEHVHNISRIIGLEAVEGLLILGKNALYLIDNFFQRSDGEIVNVWQAPIVERDSYLQMISGRQADDRNLKPDKTDHETRSWRWEDVLSISKRRFLFRDVAIEVFFVDGRSYLLTVAMPPLRDALYQKLLTKAQAAASSSTSSPEDSWRLESLKSPEDNPQTLGSRFTSVFAQNNTNPATKKWIKGEMSNFHYLMHVNTMAGRTFNDLTQYPVFPWVIADYTSAELDLTSPRSYRDLSKPMGCQTAEREAEFKERYQSFAEMGDHNSPPFHYGTHYSSAMIVTSYMIRLPPFVQSYLLLQGGNFDHPDRMFYSIEQAWASASKDNMTDVRELTPEFFYLPEFLQNINGYDFGTRQGSGGRVDNVILPPWANGDPQIFIAKNREALESEHVSKNLHHWIDLIFGHKQRGDAAIEATNVFHYLSYRGAKNLDEIADPVERLATIGIIHNFGQTPHQVFQRPHAQREDERLHPKRLDALADTLTRLPFPLLERGDRIASLLYSAKHDRILSAGPFRLNLPPRYDKYMEWGFIDDGVRFFATDSKKPVGMFEHLHSGQLSCALFVDVQTLVTASIDCTISVWSVVASAKAVELLAKSTLFGHRAGIVALAASRAFSSLVSADRSGQVLLWDLNRLSLVRSITHGKPVECVRVNDVTGTILLCRGAEIALFSLNGAMLLEQHVCVEGDDAVLSCAFYEGSGMEVLERELVFTGHKRGVVNVWAAGVRGGRWGLEHVKRLTNGEGGGSAGISAILPVRQAVYTGDEEGKVYEWDCIERQ